MEDVQFDLNIDEVPNLHGSTIFECCFNRYVDARNHNADWSELVPKTETVFEYLVQEGEKRGFNVKSLLEIPNSKGETCFSLASDFSQKISSLIIGRGIKVNSITTEMMVPAFEFSDLTVKMLEKKINPLVIAFDGNNSVDYYPSSFESDEAKRLMAEFPRSINFAVEDITCGDSCAPNCSSKFERFYTKNGDFVKMIDSNRIGQGGFGSVFKGSFHGKDMAMKCLLIDRLEGGDPENAILELEKNIREFRSQEWNRGTGVIIPEGFVRQQNQEQDENGEWIAKNYNIYIYPLFDCNLYELREKHPDHFTEEIIGNIIDQCFNRNDLKTTDSMAVVYSL